MYAAIYNKDANFKQKSRDRKVLSGRSATERDPSLAPGWGTFVDDGPYKACLASHTNPAEVRLFNAIFHLVTFSPVDIDVRGL